jgi:hypothetical protein
MKPYIECVEEALKTKTSVNVILMKYNVPIEDIMKEIESRGFSVKVSPKSH